MRQTVDPADRPALRLPFNLWFYNPQPVCLGLIAEGSDLAACVGFKL